jgi:hypothetical protein
VKSLKINLKTEGVLIDEVSAVSLAVDKCRSHLVASR